MTSSTETQSRDFTGLDTWENERILGALIAGQERGLAAVKSAIPQISAAATALAKCLEGGGRLFYAGAGTSIRIGVQDGAELSATFGMDASRITYLIAGGRAAMFDTLGDAEDDAQAGTLAACICKRGDALITIAASGTTPYTVAAANRARGNGATVIAVVNNANTPLAAAAEFAIFLNSGPEVIAGSTRLGAGTAQKAALNLLSTLTHIRLGAVHDGLMVNVQASNAKLKARAIRIVSQVSGATALEAGNALDVAGGAVKPAVLLCAGAASLGAAQQLLAGANNNLRLALARVLAP